ncbi:transposase [Rhodovibrio sodomensis]|uniref:transposase n=1 Tax=Rhodovibrio sodomensis TaxID=1088 RepID=UPI003F583FCF
MIVTNLEKGKPRGLYADVYCRRGQAENHIKAFKTHLAGDRTSGSRATANQMRLFLHAATYWLLWTLRTLSRDRTLAPKRSQWRKAQFDTIRLRLLKVAAKVTEYATRVVVQLPSAYPDQAIARLLGAKIPQLTAPP